MGLAGPKKKTKISHDPNNTKWTRDTEGFGHKIMKSQGWEPGKFLGAQNAAHAEFHTAANASHIRVVLKDDNLGLGAKVGSGVGVGECTGLDAFQNLLGRLNASDQEEFEKEQKSREDLKRAIYTEQKWGSIRFVRGGFLVGDKIQELIEGEEQRVRKLAEPSKDSDSNVSSASSSDSEAPEPVVEETKKSKKKRKAEVLEEPTAEVVAFKVKKSKKDKEKKRKSGHSSEDTEEAVPADSESRKSKKKSKKQPEIEVEETRDNELGVVEKQKKEKKDKKRERKEKKEKSQDSSVEDVDAKAARKKAKREKKEKRRAAKADEDSSNPISKPTSGASTPLPTTSSGHSTPIMLQGRHAVRSRNIAAKRLAGMDLASLNQIFMIKSQT